MVLIQFLQNSFSFNFQRIIKFLTILIMIAGLVEKVLRHFLKNRVNDINEIVMNTVFFLGSKASYNFMNYIID